MQYLLLVYEPAGYEDKVGEATIAEIVAKHWQLASELTGKGLLISGNGLQGVATATTVLMGQDGAQTLHDGPFAETREQLGGYYLIDVPDLDAALHWARRVPGVPGAKCEVRPVIVH